MKHINIYTDGGCRGNQNDVNIGAYGTVIEDENAIINLSNSFENTTNNIMELTAVLEGFKYLKDKNISVNVYSDSAYVVNCFRDEWYKKWEKNNFINSKKQEVENKELWIELLHEFRKFHSVTFYKIKGHLNVNKPAEINKWYKKFKTQGDITLEEYIHIVHMNHKADELLNIEMNRR